MTRNELEIMINKNKKLNKRQIAAIEELTGHKHFLLEFGIQTFDTFTKEDELWNEKSMLWIGKGVIVWTLEEKNAYGEYEAKRKGIPYQWLLPLGKILEGEE